MKKPRIKHVMAIGATCLLVVFIVIIVCDVLVTSNAKARTFDDVSDVPHNKVGLLLATSPITPQGEHNYYFDNRVKAADELYKAGKVDFIIASGGDYTRDHTNGCDEPSAIRDSLIARGIPENRIVLDYDGTRTLNSIAKAREIYDLDSLTLISQKYHNERALYLADKYGLHAVGYNAAPSPVRSKRIKNTLREYLARVKMFIDLKHESIPDFEKCDVYFELPDNQTTATTTSFLDLFYGMEKDSTGKYFDPLLDTIPGLIHKECKSIWYSPMDSVRFEMSMGLYIDKSYPSDIVKDTVFSKLNAVIPTGFSYDIDEKQDSLLKIGVNPAQSADAFIRGWEQIFKKASSLNGYNSNFSNYPMIIGSRGCAVCHKIYEDSIWATYIVEMSMDYHGSNGCPSSADYYTVNKSTGKILSIKEFMAQRQSTIERQIRKEYVKTATSKGFNPSDYTAEELIGKANGIAKLNKGILLYFHPYNIGCGAEGQYNLIIPVRE